MTSCFAHGTKRPENTAKVANQICLDGLKIASQLPLRHIMDNMCVIGNINENPELLES